MSNHTNTKSQSATDATVGSAEEVFDGEILDEDDNTINAQSNPLTRFVKRHKTWFVAGAAVTVGFILHGFLARPDDCVVDYDDDSGELEYDDESNPETE